MMQPIIDTQPADIPEMVNIPEMFTDLEIGITFNVSSVLGAILYRKAEFSANGIMTTPTGHVTVFDGLQGNIGWNNVVRDTEGGWSVTIGWAVTKNASHLDECLFFGRKMRGGEFKWLIALSQHNFVAWLSNTMCDKIIAKGIELAGMENSEANRRTFGRVIEKAVLSHAYLNEQGSVAGFSLGKELLEMVDEYKIKSVAWEKRTRKENGERFNVLRAWDILGESKIERIDKV